MGNETPAQRDPYHMIRTFSYRSYQLSYEVHGSGDRVLVWLHGLLLDANLSRSLAAALARRGHCVVLLDLLGHGKSDKPRHASVHRMDLYAEQVVGLLDELGVRQAVVGGVSLGANVSLETAVAAPERVRGLILHMPVLEWAVPAAASTFVPLLLAVHYARPVVRTVARAVSRLPRTGFGPLDSALNAVSLDPDEMSAVLHGLLLGPIAPTVDQRHSIQVPTLVLAHSLDLIHPLSDAANLAKQLPDARLIRTQTMLDLWVRPRRLVNEFADFLDAAFRPGPELRYRPRPPDRKAPDRKDIASAS
jgi:pimeloyl-ACP methyl ester carboxylesterase